MASDRDLVQIVSLSLQVSGGATVLSTFIAIPLAATIAIKRFKGRHILISVLNAMMGLPPVVVGLVVYILLSRSGPFGDAGLLYTPMAMLIAQMCLITPLVLALAIAQLDETNNALTDFFLIYRVGNIRRMTTLIYECRYRLVTTVLAGFGRASAEVGAVMIVGGNIDNVTRVMTTTIALESSKGRLELAVALGIVLIAITIVINVFIGLIKKRGERWMAI
ncbi:MAG: ABC transporter permease [Gammaproteobacteria bacterium]|nr:ABC transporter permease [Gammaproteobacteria bacterium]